ncbi:unnamed protein product [Bursaphelenchus xylophilus]|uniref:Uridine diphosphate glucose pyrophosphatase NUDT14 n=1 Tax=Bursaphelenchus xylophilus TaxID=6326 RepID=A0A1I7SU56_BURXY|nr:unnamed protein product [Bursaphelenchus xylophilus]CAG9107557.1 unnamed protein product [Bursaphelenchus xylophilus]
MAKKLKNICFEENVKDSKYVRPMRATYELNGSRLTWDMAFENDSVSIVLFHTKLKKIVLVKQFRAVVFFRNILRLPENKGKSYNDINFHEYDVQIGETMELCAGIVDKPLGLKEIAMEEVLEECGYKVDDLELVKSFVDGVGISGAEHTIFFGTVTDEQKVSEGGGNPSEGEFIEIKYLTIEEVRTLLKEVHNCPPSLLYGLSWFLENRKELYSA